MARDILIKTLEWWEKNKDFSSQNQNMQNKYFELIVIT